MTVPGLPLVRQVLKSVVLLSALFAAAQSLAHAPADGLKEWNLDPEVLAQKAPVEGFPNLAREYLQHGGLTCTPDQLKMLQASHAFFMAARSEAEDHHEEVVFRAAGEVLLERFMESVESAVHFHVETDHAHRHGQVLHHLPREGGIILLHVTHGSATGQQGFWVEKDLETHQEHNDKLIVPFLEDGESWVLLKFLKPPEEPATVNFGLQAVGAHEASFPAFLKVKSDPTGMLLLSIYDENGQPTAAMVELRSLKTNFLYRPSGAIDYSEQMDNIAGTPVPAPERPDAGQGVPYIASIPGESWGMYYCVGEPSDMAVPAGDWSLKVWKGPEYGFHRETFTVKEGKEARVDVHLDRWINMKERGWYSGDDHIHSRLMSDQDADRLMVFMEATDLHVGNILLMGNNLRTFYPQRGFGKEYRVQEGDRVLVPGQEDPRYLNGHAIGLNITSLVRDVSKYLYNDWVADEVHAQGGLYGFAHMIFNTFNIISDLTLLMPADRGDFGEIHQSGILETELYYHFLNLGFELAAAGGSDIPYSHMMGEVRLYCYTGQDSLDPDAWFEALRNGNTFVTNGPMVDIKVAGSIPGEEIEITKRTSLPIQVQALGPDGGGAPARLELIHMGEVIASETSTDRSINELSLELELPVEFGGWVAVRAYSHDGQGAHSTPVYIRRDGFRSWDVEKAPALIDRCLEVMAQRRTELERVIALEEAGAFHDHDVYGPQLAEMAPGGIERALKAEAYYRDLKGELEAEIERRKELKAD